MTVLVPINPDSSNMLTRLSMLASEPIRESFLVLHNTDAKVARIVATQIIKEGQAPPPPLSGAQLSELRTSIDFAETIAKAMTRIIAGELQEIDWDIDSYVASLPGYSAAVEAASDVDTENPDDEESQ